MKFLEVFSLSAIMRWIFRKDPLMKNEDEFLKDVKWIYKYLISGIVLYKGKPYFAYVEFLKNYVVIEVPKDVLDKVYVSNFFPSLGYPLIGRFRE